MRARGFRTMLPPVAAAAAVLTAAGCVQQVDGTAHAVRSVDADAARSYGYTDNRCGLLTDDSVRSLLSADNVVRPYSGAVCQYVLSRDDVVIDATFAWFDTGDLDRERALAVERGAEVSDTVIDRRTAFLARRDTTGSGCAATAAAGGGVLSWWVQVRGTRGADACPDARALLSATLRSDM